MDPGLYDRLITAAMEANLAGLADPLLYTVAPVDDEDAHSAIAQFVEHLLVESLSRLRGDEAAQRRHRLASRILQAIREELAEGDVDSLTLATPLRRLLARHDLSRDRWPQKRPDTPLARSALLTGTRLDPSLGSQLRKEIATADRVDILCSFIKWSGLRILLDELRDLTERPADGAPRLRIVTTSYMGATDPRALEVLGALPNTEVRVSYDTQRTRLHAKAYLFRRATGFGSAYVGSANLSHPALSEGLEWTTKVSEFELPYLWAKLTGTFDTYWADSDFEPFAPESHARFRQAISRQRGAAGEAAPFVRLDVHPYPFQEEVLDILAAERTQRKFRHLVVAATGTGKTMIAAFDYARVARAQGRRPSLLFVAHREEILKQALAAYRAVLGDQNFGDLLVGAHEPEQMRHLFCSIQSYNARGLWTQPADAYEYVVVDEFHHAAAPTYRRLLATVTPQILLGLTATPERSDELDVLQWFDGRASAEIRLPDAINRRLLSPFQYFGIADSVDLSELRWQRGYRIEDLDAVYTGNDARAALVLRKVEELLLDPRRARGIGFCVSVGHAEFMARYCSAHGLPAEALTGESSMEQRRTVQRRLLDREINFVFVVDLYNEGVDIPEVDTLLLLRPTESVTLYLQQLGRGLRLHPEKECLTVLDFIAAHRREYRFAPRLRALCTDPGRRVDREVEQGFPHLPAGCTMRLERVAQQRVLDNIRQSLRLVRPRLVEELRDWGRYLGRAPTMAEAIEYFGGDPQYLLRRGLWSALLHQAGLREPLVAPDEEQLTKGLRRLCHVNDPLQLTALLRYLAKADADPPHQWLAMLHVSLWGTVGTGWSLADADVRLRNNPSAIDDLTELFTYQLAHAPAPNAYWPGQAGPLALHADYTRDEALIGLGHWSLERRPDHREGVLHLPALKADAFFVTLQKTEEDYSPTTMYEDYLISSQLFHWQSQSTTSAAASTGQRYIHHVREGYTPLLFVRESRSIAGNLSAPYTFLGPCRYVSHEGSRPMSIIWRLEYAVPARLLRTLRTQQAV